MNKLLLGVIGLGLIGIAVAAGTAGMLDTSFGVDGVSVEDFGFDDETVFAVAFQSNGKLIAVGNVRHAIGPDPSDEITDMGVTRYNTDGTIDTSFGTAGSVSPFVTNESANAIDVAVDSSDRIVIVGYQRVAITTTSGKGKKKKTATTIVQPVAIVRLLSDGSPDTSFGNNGIVLTDVPGSDRATANSVVLLSNGDILVAGQATATSTSGKGRRKTRTESEAALLLRYNSDGTLDNGFGEGGILVDDFSTGNDAVTIHGLGVQSDGRILIGCRSGTVRRYHADGALDTSFGTSGQVDDTHNDFLGLTGLTIDGQDRILVASVRSYDDAGADREGVITRHAANGTVDWTYVTGLVASNELNDVAVDSNGKVVSGGTWVDGSASRGFVVRVNADGTADNGFGGGGISDPLSSAATALDIINDVAVDTDDNIVFAGGRTDSAVAAQDWLLARYCGN